MILATAKAPVCGGFRFLSKSQDVFCAFGADVQHREQPLRRAAMRPTYAVNQSGEERCTVNAWLLV